jgi:hypothetical protein
MEDQLEEQQPETSPAETAAQAIAEPGKVEAEDISRTQSTERVLMTLGNGEELPGRNTVQSTVSIISPASVGRHIPSGRVLVKIEYPRSWKKDKHFKDGDIKEVAKETADQFIKAGFAGLVEESKAE